MNFLTTCTEAVSPNANYYLPIWAATSAAKSSLRLFILHELYRVKRRMEIFSPISAVAFPSSSTVLLVSLMILRDERLLVHHLVDATGDNLLAMFSGGQQVFLHFAGALTLHHLLVGIEVADVLGTQRLAQVLREFLELSPRATKSVSVELSRRPCAARM